MSNWNQAICERCWIDRNTENTNDANGEFALRMPVVIPMGEHTEINQCAYCGLPTIFGCFVRVNPNTVPFPTWKEE